MLFVGSALAPLNRLKYISGLCCFTKLGVEVGISYIVIDILTLTARRISSCLTGWRAAARLMSAGWMVMQANADAADLLDSGEALAYAVGTCVAIVDIARMKIAAVLAGCHRYAWPFLQAAFVA